MPDMSFSWQIEEFMVYCQSRQLRQKTISSYEQALRLFERWCKEHIFIPSGPGAFRPKNSSKSNN